MTKICRVSDPWRHHPPNGSQAIREGRGRRRSQIFPLKERHDFHHCFCCPGNQGQPSGEYSKRTPCLSLLSDPLPCTPFPDHPLAPRSAPILYNATTIFLVILAQNLQGRTNFLISASLYPTLCTIYSSTATCQGSSHHTHLPHGVGGEEGRGHE